MKKPIFAGGFAGLQAARGVTKKAANAGTQIPCGDDNKKEDRAARPLRKKGNPEFDQVTIYIPKDMHRDAWRKWQDAGGKEFSDLCEKLCGEYLAR